ncbi:hypothetical protein AOLI_G00278080 [Acnodon oligacanthus]
MMVLTTLESNRIFSACQKSAHLVVDKQRVSKPFQLVGRIGSILLKDEPGASTQLPQWVTEDEDSAEPFQPFLSCLSSRITS